MLWEYLIKYRSTWTWTTKSMKWNRNVFCREHPENYQALRYTCKKKRWTDRDGMKRIENNKKIYALEDLKAFFSLTPTFKVKWIGKWLLFNLGLIFLEGSFRINDWFHACLRFMIDNSSLPQFCDRRKFSSKSN